MLRRRRLALAGLAAVLLAACSGGDPGWTVDELLGVGEPDPTTVPLGAVTQNAFGLPAPGLDTDERRDFEIGDSFFTQPWVIAPSSTAARDGLGPEFNANSCAACHVRDGRGRPPEEGGPQEPGLLLRLSVPGEGPLGGPVPHPRYGGQLQDQAVPGVTPEGRIAISTTVLPGAYPDGTPYELQRPVYQVVDWSDGEPDGDLLVSPRVAPQVIGMGLLEAIPEGDLLAAADPDDADGDGVSGRINRVWSPTRGRDAVGRFGWKANVATVHDQVAAAFNEDIGITSPTLPDEEGCEASPIGCGAGADEPGAPEIDADRMDRVVFYSRTLAVPAVRAPEDLQVRRGAELFEAATCTACHTPVQRTGRTDVAALSERTFRPYTDLLLHDMGEGLADGRPDFEATGSEWRTAPLWGLGLVDDINGHTRFLHDGRARSLEEAVLWHGGEAQAARDAFTEMTADDRAALLRFVEAL